MSMHSATASTRPRAGSPSVAARSPPAPSTRLARPGAISSSVSSARPMRTGCISKGLSATGPSRIRRVAAAARASRTKWSFVRAPPESHTWENPCVSASRASSAISDAVRRPSRTTPTLIGPRYPADPARSRSLSRPAQESPCCTMPLAYEAGEGEAGATHGAGRGRRHPPHPRAHPAAGREAIPHGASNPVPQVRQHLRRPGAGVHSLSPLRQARTDRRRAARAAGALGDSLRPPHRLLRARAMALDSGKLRDFVQKTWDESIVPALTEYVKIPAKSPMFDAQWREHGHIDRAVELVRGWAGARSIEGLRIEVVRLEGRTPLLLMEAPGTGTDTVLLYGHLDKQPEMVGWAEGTGPWTPVRRGDKLYGRGVGDDGYAAFAALTAIQALQEQRSRHARCVVLIEACEESGSHDLPYYVDALKAKLGTPSLVVCLDSGCGNYDQLWGTTSLRGVVGGVLTVEVLTEGVHSGAASGIVPSSFRILRQRVAEARAVATALGTEIYDRFPFPPGARPVSTDAHELVLNNAWRPALAITGAAGLTLPADGGNVLRPKTALKISLRLPPTCDAGRAVRRLKEILEADPPYGARVTLETYGEAGNGWDAPATSPWLLESVDRASTTYFGKPAVFHGLGGSIPFMSMLGERFPRAQFLITGAMGPGSNAHGPNEFLHLPTGVRVTACVAQVLADHHRAATR